MRPSLLVAGAIIRHFLLKLPFIKTIILMIPIEGNLAKYM